MNRDAVPQSLGLRELAQACAKQETLYRERGAEASNPLFCYELFRRAIVQKDERAWSLIYQQYEPQIIGWIHQSSAFRSTGQDAHYFVNEVFAKFWHAVSPEKFSEQLTTLGAVLLYLKKCVGSTLYSYLRALKRESMQAALEEAEGKGSNPASKRSIEHSILQADAAERLWGLVKSSLKNDQERVIAENALLLGKKARHIQEEYAHLFSDVRSVYRAKENLLKRLRRNLDPKSL